MDNQETEKELNRRGFLHSSAAAGAGLVLSRVAFAQSTGKKPDDLNIALLGAGKQGRILLTECLRIRGVRIRALCDIWKAYNQRRTSEILKRYRQKHNVYDDYKEMLAKERDLDAVIIATPDFWHARQTINCLKAGLHVYCERPMATRVGDARRMVRAARDGGKLLQIGHHRRSNPRYIHCYEQLIRGANILGHVEVANAFWHIPSWRRGWPKTMHIEPQTLAKYDYESMEQFANWRWCKTLGTGVLGSFGSDQIDVFNWFFEGHPRSAVALGSISEQDSRTQQWPDKLTAACDYQTENGDVRALYQTLSGSNALDHFEGFIGENVALIISDGLFRLACNLVGVRACWASGKWGGDHVKDLRSSPMREMTLGALGMSDFLGVLAVEETHTRQPPVMSDLQLSVKLDKPPLQLHLENFFESIRSRGKVKLNCPAEVGYETAVTVLKVNEAVEAGRKLEFKPDEFKV
ncbi:MAG: Gfo/Idh/MocA family oxidoreductase [Planctomycetes bacterium]|nr:Gfo/Idh/MocA family oxidoreductase [Planctomycetota bacterium]